MADPIYIDASGNQIPAQSTLEPSYIDATGKTIDPRVFQKPQGTPSLQDIAPEESTVQGVTRGLTKTLPGVGAAAFTALAPEAPVASGIAGASAGSALQNFLRSYSPKYFSENGQAPNATDQATNIGVNAGLEGTGQLLSAAAPSVTKGALALGGRFSPSVERETAAQGLEKLKGIARQGDKAGTALQNVLDEGMKGDKISDTDAIRKALDDKTLTHSWNTSMVADPNTGTRTVKSYDDMISPTVRENLKQILDATDKFAKEDSKAPATLFQKGGKYLLKVGTGTALGGFVGMPETGAMAANALILGNSALQKIAQSPAMTKAMITAMKEDTPPALSSLARQGLLNGLRGEEMYFQHPDGTKEKVRISDQGVPQAIR
jgi:hypothetical protein